jgi:membrane protein implicated in regulation of membrane protease activity
MDPWTALFLVGGLVLLASELAAPSLFAMFLGIAALVTAGLRGLGVLDSVPASFVVWAVTSLALVVPFRRIVQRLVPGRSVVKHDATDVEHDREAMGEVVLVVEDVSDDDDDGRIRFQGTTWQARSTSGKFKEGERVQLVYRSEGVWVVEAVGAGVDGLLETAPGADASAAVSTGPARAPVDRATAPADVERVDEADEAVAEAAEVSRRR